MIGVAAAALAIGWGLTLGGGLALGRLDPLFSLPGRILFAAAMVFVMRDRSRADVLIAGGAMLACSFAIDALLATVLAARFAWEQAILALAVQTAAWGAGLGVLVYRSKPFSAIARGGIAFVAVATAAAAAWLTPSVYAPATPSERPRVAIVSGVPIEWDGPVDMAAILDDSAQLSPLLPVLAERFAVVRPDAIDATRLSGIDVLVLAHPRPLVPGELVDIDSWVRDGGKVLVLADALLSWPPDYPLGDARNPPITSLLTPLFDHWGLELDVPAIDGSDSSDIFMAGDYRVHALSMGRFRAKGPDCTVALGGRTAECKLGRGRAVLIADADLLNPAIWTGGDRNPAHWREGNIDWIIASIRELAGADSAEWVAPVWRAPGPDESSRQHRVLSCRNKRGTHTKAERKCDRANPQNTAF